MGYASWDYSRVSQVYQPVAQRSDALRDDTLTKVSGTWLFADAVDFAILTTTPVNPETVPRWAFPGPKTSRAKSMFSKAIS